MGKGVAVRRRQACHGVIGVTAHAVGILQALMKRRHLRAGRGRRARDGKQTDIFHQMARRAARLGGALQRDMAGKAISGQTGMCRDQRPGGQHRTREDKGKGDDPHKTGGDERKDPACHDHPQKITALTICADPRTVKASVTGKCSARHFLTVS